MAETNTSVQALRRTEETRRRIKQKARRLLTDADNATVSLREFKIRRDEADDLDDGCGNSHQHHRPFDASGIWPTQGENENELHDTEASSQSNGRESSGPDTPFVMVVERLTPCDQGEGGEGLRLEFESKVEVLDNRVDTKWHAAFVVSWVSLILPTSVEDEQEGGGGGNSHIDQRMSMVPGRPSVLFRRQFVHICGMICIHQQL